MTTDDLAKLRSLFEEVRDLPADQVESALTARCEGDQALASRVRRLLAASGEAGEFLEGPAAALDGAALEQAFRATVAPTLIGERLGAFLVTSKLGEGGMGVVYLAVQDQPRREVALKLIRSPFAGTAVRRRFELESELLARLSHPGIAQVYEAGSLPIPSGERVPYFAMELVRGTSLLNFATTEQLTVPARLRLFARVCDAVQHAHAKGVIHRDLKPSNLLVVRDADGREPQPKVLDFGVAKLADSDAAMATLQTTSGQVIGTLAYMSPEQVAGRSDEVDVRSDVYALGVVLYELLTGRLPYDTRGRSLPQIARIITETDPVPPSSEHPELQGDLETILLKALAKEPSHRYQSAAELGADLTRCVDHQPVLARPATTTYLLKKFARRNRVLVGGVLAAVLLLVVGVIGTSIGLLKARTAQRVAEKNERTARTEATKATRSIAFLVDMLTAVDPERAQGRDVTVAEVLDRAAARVEPELAESPEVRGAIESAIGRTYNAVGKLEPARAHLESATAVAAQLYGPESIEVGVARTYEALLAGDDRRWQDADRLGCDAMRLLGPLKDSHDSRYVAVLRAVGLARGAQRRYADAIPMLREAVALDEAAGREKSQSMIESLRYLGTILGRLGGEGPIREGEAILKRAVDIAEVHDGVESPNYARTLADFGGFYYTQSDSAHALGPYERALAIMEKCYGPSDRRTLEVVSALGRTYSQLNDLPRAEAMARRAVEGFEASGQTQASEYASALSRLGGVLFKLKRLPDAEAMHRRAADLRRTIGHADLTVSLGNIAQVLSAQGKPAEAVPLLVEAMTTERQRGFPRADATGLWEDLALALAATGKTAEAEQTFRDGLAFAAERQPNHVSRAAIHMKYAAFLRDQHRWDDALRAIEPASDLLRRLKHSALREAEGIRADVLEGLGRRDEAAAARAASLPAKATPAPGTPHEPPNPKPG